MPTYREASAVWHGYDTLPIGVRATPCTTAPSALPSSPQNTVWPSYLHTWDAIKRDKHHGFSTLHFPPAEHSVVVPQHLFTSPLAPWRGPSLRFTDVLMYGSVPAAGFRRRSLLERHHRRRHCPTFTVGVHRRDSVPHDPPPSTRASIVVVQSIPCILGPDKEGRTFHRCHHLMKTANLHLPAVIAGTSGDIRDRTGTTQQPQQTRVHYDSAHGCFKIDYYHVPTIWTQRVPFFPKVIGFVSLGRCQWDP